jgi:DNA (cytosine-5)-methyltransferase 1
MFEGTFDSLFLQIGNAVPPLVARVMAEHILSLLVQEQPLLAELDRANDIDRPVGPGFAVTINGIKRKNVRQEPVEA